MRCFGIQAPPAKAIEVAANLQLSTQAFGDMLALFMNNGPMPIPLAPDAQPNTNFGM